MGWGTESVFGAPPLSFVSDGDVVEMPTEKPNPVEESAELPEAS